MSVQAKTYETTKQHVRVLGAELVDKDHRLAESLKPPPSLLSFIGLAAILSIIAYVVSEIANYREIRRNWATYRCHPSVAPFAKFYGHDVTETMNFCVSEAVKEHAPGVITPIYEGVTKVMGVVDGVYEKAEAIEGGVRGLLSGFESFVMDFVNSFRLVGTRVRMSLIRIKDIFARVYGTFIAFAYAAISAITFGENITCNPMVQFVGDIAGYDICCFAPETGIVLDDGSVCPISNIAIGTRLYGGSVVTSQYLFDGATTRMCRIAGIHVSGNHYVRNPDGEMVHADEHPNSVDAESLPEILCLATTDNRIPVMRDDGRVLICADYEESYHPDVIAEAQRVAEQKLNGARWMPMPTVADYTLGVDAGVLVDMWDGSTKRIADMHLGDTVRSGARVVGLIREQAETVYTVAGGAVAFGPAQLVFREGRWIRAAHIFPSTAGPQVLCHLMLTGGEDQVLHVRDSLTGDQLYTLRDYAEIDDDAIQAPYDRAMISQS